VDVALNPFFPKQFILSRPERQFYKILRGLVAPNPVLIKVRLADLIEADEEHQLHKVNFDAIKAKHIDFLVCDAALSPIIAVELDDSSHQRPDRKARDRDVDRIFQLASFPLVHIPQQQSYDPADIEKQLLTTLRHGTHKLRS
jgi:hypothetical protein